MKGKKKKEHSKPKDDYKGLADQNQEGSA